MTGFKCIRKKLIVVASVLSVVVAGRAYGQTHPPAKVGKPLVTKTLSATVATPALIGKTKAAAEVALKKAGLKMGTALYTSTGKGKPGTVVKQQPAAKTRAAKGSAVTIWLLGNAPDGAQPAQGDAASGLKPKLVARGKTLFMEFAQNMRNVTVFDANGKILQQFKSGRRFDITPSLVKTKAGLIKVTGEPQSGGVQKRRGPSDPPDCMEIPLYDFRHFYQRWVEIEDDRTIDRHEPANNSIAGAPLVSAGYYSGEVGGGDATDYLKATAGVSGVGTLIQVEVKSGAVELHYYYPNRVRIDGNTNKFWIALAPGTTFYFQVSPTGAAATDYRIRISKKRLDDAYEVNDTFAQAKVFGAGRAFLGNVINSSSLHVGVSDFYKINVPEPQNLRIVVTNAGLATGNQVQISLYNAHNTLDISGTGGANSCTLERDLRLEWPRPDEHPVFPAGQWRIEVRTPTATAGYPAAYGNGDPPNCYTQPAGYTLTVTVRP
jgi:hypothetical protein